jgi:hypothetical protein
MVEDLKKEQAFRRTLVNLATPVRSERCKNFVPHRKVYVYHCRQEHEVRVFATASAGGRPVPGVGAVACSQCTNRE